MREIGRYLIERVFTVHVIMLVGLLFALTFVVASTTNVIRIGERAIIVILVTLAFRLWDDLADLEHDRQAHPDRVLCRSENYLPFVGVLCATVFAAAMILLSIRSYWHVGVLTCSAATLLLIYRSNLPRPISIGLVLCKYPIIVMLCIPAAEIARAPRRLALAMTGSWLCVAVHDILHHHFASSSG